MSFKRIFIIFTGSLLFLVGLIGLIMPIMPGWPFIFIGLSLIAPAAAFTMKYRIEQNFFKRGVVYFSEWKKYRIDAGVTTKFLPIYFKSTGDLDQVQNQEKLKEALQKSPVAHSHQISFNGTFAYLHQVHGGEVAVIENLTDHEKPGFYRFAGTDGAITNIPGLVILAMTADCLSVFLRAPGWVGVVHAGWRGTHQQIAKKAVLLIIQKAQCAAAEVHVIFGPSICGRHYEVGAEFSDHFLPPSLRKKNKKYYFSLVEENKKQLVEAGVQAGNISASGFCTVSENKHFYSFRKEKDSSGRMISFVQLR